MKGKTEWVYKWIVIVAIVVVLGYYVGTLLHNDSGIITPGPSTKQTTSVTDTKNYSYTDAPSHIGEYAKVSGPVVTVFTSKTGTTFLDFCSDYSSCPFSAVIFASDNNKFPNLSQYQRNVTITGLIKSYQGRAEIIINSPDQISTQ